METIKKGPKEFTITLEMKNVSPQDAGSYRVTAKNALGESNATIGLNFDGMVSVFEACLLYYACVYCVGRFLL